jgi:hypothetical protein
MKLELSDAHRVVPLPIVVLAAFAAAALAAGCEVPEAEPRPEEPVDLPEAALAQGGPDERALIPDVIPTDGYVSGIAAGPSGEVFYLAEAAGPSGTSRITEARWDPEEEAFTEPTPLHFSTGEVDDASPAVAPDGSYLLFTSARPVEAGDVFDFNIWVSQRQDASSGEADGEAPASNDASPGEADGEAPASNDAAPAAEGAPSSPAGEWSDPWPLPGVNSQAWDGAPSLAANGNLYFSSQRAGMESGFQIFVSELEEGAWLTPQPMAAPINVTGDDTDPWIAPDESFLLFASNRDGPFDVYVAFRDEVGGWLDPVPLGDAVNTEADERAPAVSPGGGFIYFYRSGEGMQWIATADAGLEEYLEG